MIVAGVTGGIGSGKTTFCKEWEKLGARVVYADDLAKDLMVSDPELMQDLKNAFGPQTYNDDGSLNKPHLIEEAFARNRVQELNAIVHPAVGKAFSEMCKKFEKEGVKLAVKEAALLLNKGRPDGLDVVVIVTAPERERIDRVKSRDAVSDDEVKARLENQPDFSKLTHLADYVINNSGSEEELKSKARELYRQLTAES
jgi:dephospho-CoA kinase